MVLDTAEESLYSCTAISLFTFSPGARDLESVALVNDGFSRFHLIPLSTQHFPCSQASPVEVIPHVPLFFWN